MKKRIDVFISSDEDEFERERKELADRIGKIPFLECKPLEQRGASHEDVRAASLRASRECDIYVGLFGKDFSELTVEEFKEAWKTYKPCLAYVKKIYKTETRDNKLEEFIEKDLKSKVKYYPYRARKKLYEQVISDLENLLLDILHRGFEDVNESKKRAQQLSNDRKSQLENRTTIPEEEKSRQFIDDSIRLFKQGQNMSAVIYAVVSVERLLKTKMIEARPSEQKKYANAGLGFLVKEAFNLGLINQSIYNRLYEVTIMRNRLFHEGVIPSLYKTNFLINASNEIIDILSKELTNDIISEVKLSPQLIFLDDFELDKIDSNPPKWETTEENGNVRISSDYGGAEGSEKYVNISSPHGSRDYIRRNIDAINKIDISYYVRQEKYGSRRVGAGLHLFYKNKEAIWLCIVKGMLIYYDVKHNPICDIELGKWYKIQIKADCTTGTFSCLVNDKLIVLNGNFRNEVPLINMIRSTGWNRQDFWSTSIDQIRISTW